MTPATTLTLQAALTGRATCGTLLVLADHVELPDGCTDIQFSVLQEQPVTRVLQGMSDLTPAQACDLIDRFRRSTEAADLVVRAYLADRLRELARLDPFPPNLRSTP